MKVVYMSRDSGATQEFLERLGNQIRSRRKAAGLTVQQLSDSSGISRRMLTQIELGQANPSLVTVDRLARSLQTDFAGVALLPAGDSARQTTDSITSSDPIPVWTSQLGSTAEILTSTSHQQSAEMWRWVLQPGDIYRADPDPVGSSELFYVISGELVIQVSGESELKIPQGSSARLLSDRYYSYENRDISPVTFIRVVQLGS